MIRHRMLLPLLLAVGMLSISSSAILVRWCDDAPPVVIAAARLGIATIVLVPGLAATRGVRLLRIPPKLTGYILFGGLFLAAHFFFWMTSLRHTSVLSSVVIVTTNPIFVSIGSWLLLRERIYAALIVGICLAASGGVLISISDHSIGSENGLSGNLLALGGAVTASGYLLIGRKVRAEVDVFSYMVSVYGVAAVILCAAASLSGVGAAGYRWQTYACFVALAIAPQLLGHGSLNYALKHLSATFVSVCILAEPVGAGILAYLLLGETAGTAQLIGAAMILAGIFIATRGPSMAPERAAAR